MIIRQLKIFMQLMHRNSSSINRANIHIGLYESSRNKVFIKNPKKKEKKYFVVWKGMTISDLANSMNMDFQDVIEAIYRTTAVDQRLTYSTKIDNMSIISAVAKLCGGVIKENINKVTKIEEDRDLYRRNIYLNSERLQSRPPVVTIMGHVDHGKTTLLDSLRSSRIVESEFGGITQHIGAFKVSMSDISEKSDFQSKEKIVTFLDTPGHAAFSAMRARGANCTDIVVLVVAIEDGIMPQTLESIRFAKEAKVPIIVAINKIDRVWHTMEHFKASNTKSNLVPILRSLSKCGLDVEAFGGDVQCIPISALKKWNLDLLQESIIALAEIIDIKSDYEGPCEAVVLEANFIDSLGKVATILVQQGLFRKGLTFVAGNTYLKVRTITSDLGELIDQAKPGDPIEVTGWKGDLPLAGDVMIEVASELKAREVLAYRKNKLEKIKSEKDYESYEKSLSAYKSSYKKFIDQGIINGIRFRSDCPNVEDFIHNERLKNGIEIPKINLIIKTDVQGSLEAISGVLDSAIKSCGDQCLIKIAYMGVGNLTESDLEIAMFSNCVVYLFNLPQMNNKVSNVDIRHFNVIYHMFDDLKDYITDKLPCISEIEVLGEAVILEIFYINYKRKKIPVCGCRCVKGILYKNPNEYKYQLTKPVDIESDTYKVIKNDLKCRSLKHIKNDVDSIRKDNECGIALIDNNDELVTSEVGNVIQCYKMTKTRQRLIWELGFK